MIAALADASVTLSEPQYLEAARVTAEALWRTAWDASSSELLRVRFEGVSDIAARQTDYAWLANCLLARNDADAPSKRAPWLARARQLVDAMDERFLDVEGGGYFLGQLDVGGFSLLARPKEIRDASTPSGNGVASQVLAGLAARTGESDYRERADQLVAALAGPTGEQRGGLSAVLTGVAAHLGGDRAGRGGPIGSQPWPSLMRNQVAACKPVPSLEQTNSFFGSTADFQSKPD